MGNELLYYSGQRGNWRSNLIKFLVKGLSYYILQKISKFISLLKMNLDWRIQLQLATNIIEIERLEPELQPPIDVPRDVMTSRDVIRKRILNQEAHLYTQVSTLEAQFKFRRRKRRLFVNYSWAIWEYLRYYLKGLLQYLWN